MGKKDETKKESSLISIVRTAAITTTIGLVAFAYSWPTNTIETPEVVIKKNIPYRGCILNKSDYTLIFGKPEEANPLEVTGKSPEKYGLKIGKDNYDVAYSRELWSFNNKKVVSITPSKEKSTSNQ